ncbi:hypothetical protein [Membranihabitans marinus]|uniref:hypothetical protein n=1 Tax=Membranihabitans marinus TaxID=1227546 RepID=UPI001F3DDF86|nr:hypothetical protein [Membranihabitans marinus]
MNHLKVIAYSLLLIPLWGLWLLDNLTTNTYLVFLCFVATAISFDLMRESVLVKLPKSHRLLVFLGPIIYIMTMIVSIAKNPFWLYIISNPILWISIFFYLNYKYLHNLFPFAYKKWMGVLGFALFYTLSVYPYARIANMYGPKIDQHNTTEESQPNEDAGLYESIMPVDVFTRLERETKTE